MDLLQWNLYKADTLSSNINEVIRTVLNFLFYLFFFFLRKDFVPTIKHQKAPKRSKNHQKAQKRNLAKAQNANKRTKIKNALKKHLSEKK